MHRGVTRTFGFALDLNLLFVVILALLDGRAILLDGSFVIVGLVLLGSSATTLALLGGGRLDIVIAIAVRGAFTLAWGSGIDVVRLEQTLVALGAGVGEWVLASLMKDSSMDGLKNEGK